MVFNARHTLRDIDGGKLFAISKSIVSNASYTLGKDDGGEIGAIIESIVFNTRHTICLSIISDSRGNDDCSAVGVRASRHRHRQVGRVGNLIVDPIYLKIVGTCRKAAQYRGYRGQPKFVLFHNAL